MNKMPREQMQCYTIFICFVFMALIVLLSQSVLFGAAFVVIMLFAWVKWRGNWN